MVLRQVLVSAGCWRLGVCVFVLAAACACSQEPAAAPNPAKGAASPERAHESARPASSSDLVAAPTHIAVVGDVKVSTEQLLVIEPGPLGERKQPSPGNTGAGSAYVAARGPHVGTYVVLDAQAPRPLLAARTPLALLVDEDAELAPGAHQLTAYREREGGLAVLHLGFSLEDGKVEDAATTAPRCVLALPRGTYRGPDARVVRVIPIPSAGTESVRLSLSPTFGQAGAVRVEMVEGPAHAGFALRALPSGDYGVLLECLPGAGASTESRRVITIDAAVETGE